MRFLCRLLFVGICLLLGPAGAAAAPAAAAPDRAEAFLAAREAARENAGDERAVFDAWLRLEAQHPVACDWLLQDAGLDAVLQWFSGAGEQDLPERVLRKLLEETGATPETTVEAGAPPQAALTRWLALCESRRAERLAPLLARWPELVFTKHATLGGSHYAYTEAQSDAQAERRWAPGGGLFLLRFVEGSTRPEIEELLDASDGMLRDPDVHWDGDRILFSWKKSDREDDFHLYEMDVATRAIDQITTGLGFADYEGVYLPGGDILFNSTRCVQTVDCWWTEVSNLYRCDPEGRYLRRLTFDQVHDNFPTVLDDGRVIFTRWEYNDRGQIYPQPLMQMNPDGTAQLGFYGNNSWFPTSLLHARGVPGTHLVLAVASGHHSRQTGKLVRIDRSRGTEEAEGAQLIAPVRETEAVRVDAYGQNGEQFQYPYPLNAREFLVTFNPYGRRADPRFSIYFMDEDGRRERLAFDPSIPCSQPIPLAPRPRPHARPSLVDYAKETGVFYVQDVYAGPGLEGVPRGTVKKLRVVEILYREAGMGANGNRGPAGGATVSTPVAIGGGAWDPKVIHGDATVHADGSVHFEAPARKPVYFQALDAENRVVQTMRSWTVLQPGERMACVGCHEDKSDVSPASQALGAALAGGKPEKLKPFYGPPRGFSFPTEIQPILDRNCVSCHDDRARLRGESGGRELTFVEDGGALPFLVPPQSPGWRRLSERAEGDWRDPASERPDWQEGRGGFGFATDPDARLGAEWRSEWLSLRKTFTLEEGSPSTGEKPAERLLLWARHSDTVRVWLNGAYCGEMRGRSEDGAVYSISVQAERVLRPGRNLLAAEIRQGGDGERFVDVALVRAPVPGGARAFSLLGDEVLDRGAKRRWSEAYLSLTMAGGGGWMGGRQNDMVDWVNVQSAPPMLPPRHAGAVNSGLLEMLEEGHHDVKLTTEEADKIAAWMDLAVPFCGDYVEANAWNDAERERYQHFMDKRAKADAIDRRNVEAFLEAGGSR